jgi:hypothetical protein
MRSHSDKSHENKSQSTISALRHREGVSEISKKVNSPTFNGVGSPRSPFQLLDNRPEAVAQRKFQEMANNRIVQKKPTGAKTEYVDSAPKGAQVFGMRVANHVIQDGIDNEKFVVAERIQEVEASPPFKIQDKKTSEHEFTATKEDEVRVDSHLISSAAIDQSLLLENNAYYDYTVHQNFVYKKIDEDSGPVVVPHSGFEIKHRLFNKGIDDSEWTHVVTKIPKAVEVNGAGSEAGKGSAYSHFTTLDKKHLYVGKSHVALEKEPKKPFGEEL